MNEESIDMIIFSLLSRKEEFLQFLPEKNNKLFNFLNIFDFLQKYGLPPLEQADFYKIILKMLKSKYIAKRKGYFVFVSKNVKNFPASIQTKSNNLKTIIKEQKKSLKIYKKLIKKIKKSKAFPPDGMEQ